jgi:hypothetical protein
VSDRLPTRKVMRATTARNPVVFFRPLFPDGGLAWADERELIACLALSGARSDLIEQHTGSLPAISLIDGQAARGITADCRSARHGSELR